MNTELHLRLKRRIHVLEDKLQALEPAHDLLKQIYDYLGTDPDAYEARDTIAEWIKESLPDLVDEDNIDGPVEE